MTAIQALQADVHRFHQDVRAAQTALLSSLPHHVNRVAFNWQPDRHAQQAYVRLLHDLLAVLPCLCQDDEAASTPRAWELIPVLVQVLGRMDEEPRSLEASLLAVQPFKAPDLAPLCVFLARSTDHTKVENMDGLNGVIQLLLRLSVSSSTMRTATVSALRTSCALERAFEATAQVFAGDWSSASAVRASLPMLLAASCTHVPPGSSAMVTDMFKASDTYGRMLLAGIMHVGRDAVTDELLFQANVVWLRDRTKLLSGQVTHQHMQMVMLAMVKTPALMPTGCHLMPHLLRLSCVDVKQQAFSTVASNTLRLIRRSADATAVDAAGLLQPVSLLACVMDTTLTCWTPGSLCRSRWCVSSGALGVLEALVRSPKRPQSRAFVGKTALSMALHVALRLHSHLDFGASGVPLAGAQVTDAAADAASASASCQSIVASLRKVQAITQPTGARDLTQRCPSPFDALAITHVMVDQSSAHSPSAVALLRRCALQLIPSAVHQLSLELRTRFRPRSHLQSNFAWLQDCCATLQNLHLLRMADVTAASRAPLLLVHIVAAGVANLPISQSAVLTRTALACLNCALVTQPSAGCCDARLVWNAEALRLGLLTGMEPWAQPKGDGRVPQSWDTLLLRRWLPSDSKIPWCCNRRCTNLAGACEMDMQLRKCGGCRVARYCSEECQRRAWRTGHRAACIDAPASPVRA